MRLQEDFLLQAKSDDTIIVFLAGHGVRTTANRYWFLTSNTTVEKPWKGIDGPTLKQLLTWDRLQAKKRVMLIDTCHSGKAVNLRGVSMEKLFKQEDFDNTKERSREGIYVLAGSYDDEFAREQGENGIFTRALLDGLAGRADMNRDGSVEIEEWLQFAKDEVHEKSLGKQHVAIAQGDWSENFRVAKVLGGGKKK